jgi:cytidyltransferase-like protein
MNYLVIYPGRFHPFHLGHKASYDWLTQQFGENSVYVASSDKQEAETSPFAYADKVKMATKLGVPAGRIKQVKNP